MSEKAIKQEPICDMQYDFPDWELYKGCIMWRYTCSFCGDSHLHLGSSKPRACPCCGRKVEELVAC